MSERSALSVFIDRPAAQAYEFLCEPENFPKWASGLARSLRQDGEDWMAETPDGPAKVRFSDRNTRGVLDHSIKFANGLTVFVALRLVSRGEGCELVVTLNRRPGMSDEKLAADAEWVMRDLNAAKRILETRKDMT